MPIMITGKVFRVQRNQAGPLCEVVYLMRECDFADPAWTRESDRAHVFPWDDAEEMARRLNGHAIVVGGKEPESEVARVPLARQTPEPPPRRTRHRTPKRFWPMANLHKVRSYQSELERRKLS